MGLKRRFYLKIISNLAKLFLTHRWAVLRKKVNIGLMVLSLSSCGVFIKKPQYTLQENLPSTIRGTSYLYADGKSNFIDSRMHENSKNIVLLLHGLGAHAGGFTAIQTYFDAHKISSVSVDLRGFGHWKGKRGDLKNIGLQLNDVHEIVKRIQADYPEKKIQLLGESLGSSLSLWYASLHPENIDGLIITSLVTTSKGNKVKAGTVFRALFSYTFNPAHPIRLDFDPSLYTSTTDWYTADTLSTRKISPRYLIQANEVIKKSRTLVCTADVPIFILQGGADVLSTKEGIAKIINQCPVSKIHYAYYPKMKHSIVNDIHKDMAFEDIRAWLRR